MLFQIMPCEACPVNRLLGATPCDMAHAIGLALSGRARAAVASGDGETRLVDDRPLAVGLTDAGEVVVGEGAVALDERRRADGFVADFGRAEPYLVGGVPYGAETLVAQVLRSIADAADAAHPGSSAVALAYDSSWSDYQLDLLQHSVRLAAVGDVALVADTTAREFGGGDDLAIGAAVWALGRRDDQPAPVVVGSPVTARQSLLAVGALSGAGAGAAAVGANAAPAATAAVAGGFGAGASMGDFGPSMEAFGSGGRKMRAFIAAAAVAAVVVVGGAAAVLATRGGSDKGDDVSTRRATTSVQGEVDLDDPVAVAAALGGSFELTTTVVDGNPSYPVGKTETFTLAVTSSCDAGRCEVEIENVGSTSLAPGGEMRFAGAANEPCLKDPSITVAGSYEIVLRVTAFDDDGNVARMEGTNDQTITDLAGCPDTGIDPISFEWVMTRK